MMRASLPQIILFLFLLANGSLLNAHQPDSLPPFPSPEWRLGRAAQIGAIGDLSINSSGLTTAFYRPFVRGGHIDDQLKRETLEGMEKRNRFGMDRLISFGGSFRPDSLFGEANEERLIFIRLIDGHHAHASFTRDLFRTIFIGNANDEERAELAPFRMNSMRYRQLKVGLMDRRGPFEMGIAISGIQGRSDLRIAAQKAYLESEADGSALRFRMKGEWLQQGKEKKHPVWGTSGAGVGIDILGGYDFGRYGQVRITLKNMGLLHWGSGADIRQVDTSATFEGFELENFFGEKSIGSDDAGNEFQERYFSDKRSGSYRSSFPSTMVLSYAKQFPSGFWFRSRFKHRPFIPYVPYGEIELMKDWNGFRAGTSIGYGGFGELAFGLGAAYRFGKNWDLYLRAPHLEGVFISRSMGGLQASVGLHYQY